MSVNFDFQGSQNWLPPICGICTGGDKPRIVLVQEGKGVRHWPYEGHVFDRAPAEVHLPSTEVGVVNPVTQPDSVTKICNGCGKPVTGHGKVCNACRQKAYRERKA